MNCFCSLFVPYVLLELVLLFHLLCPNIGGLDTNIEKYGRDTFYSLSFNSISEKKFGRLVSCSDWTRHKINISVYSDIGLTQHQSNLIYDIKKMFSSIMCMSMSMFHAHEINMDMDMDNGQWTIDTAWTWTQIQMWMKAQKWT